jgi:hypothetical protein
MKIIAKKDFSKLGSGNNWAGFGKDNYLALEKGDAVEVENCSDHLLENGYVEVVKSETKTKKSKETK